MSDFLKRTWAEINLDHLDANVSTLRKALPSGTKLMGVVKADGYGHGDKYIAKELAVLGVDFFAVSNLAEALSLRREGITQDILVLGFTPPSHAGVMEHENIIQTVLSLEYAELLEQECREQGVQVRVHIKLDTGMNRIGLSCFEESVLNEVKAICRFPHLSVEGIFSHLSSADEEDADSVAYTKMQAELFESTLRQLKESGFTFPCIHLQNSAGIAFLPDFQYHYARAGIVLYGVAPSGVALPFPLQPLMELKTVVSMVKEVPAGASISYGRRFVSEHPMRIATVPIGYADGYPRALSNRGSMLVHGNRAPILGSICMDQLMLDVTEIDDVQMGDTVTVVGQEGEDYIGFSELAELVGTISYELMCLIGRRVPRVYRKGNNTVAVVDYIQE